jgi:hypothetical protein
VSCQIFSKQSWQQQNKGGECYSVDAKIQDDEWTSHYMPSEASVLLLLQDPMNVPFPMLLLSHCLDSRQQERRNMANGTFIAMGVLSHEMGNDLFIM